MSDEKKTDENVFAALLTYFGAGLLNGAIWQYAQIGHLKVPITAIVQSMAFGLGCALAPIIPSLLIYRFVKMITTLPGNLLRSAALLWYFCANVCWMLFLIMSKK